MPGLDQGQASLSALLPEGTLDLPPPPATSYRSDQKVTAWSQTQATQVHDKVLADTRAALDHLEKQLCMSVSPQTTQTTTPPVTAAGSPGFNLESPTRISGSWNGGRDGSMENDTLQGQALRMTQKCYPKALHGGMPASIRSPATTLELHCSTPHCNCSPLCGSLHPQI